MPPLTAAVGYEYAQESGQSQTENEITALGGRTDEETMFTESFLLAGFHGNVVYLEPHFNRVTNFEEAVSIAIK